MEEKDKVVEEKIDNNEQENPKKEEIKEEQPRNKKNKNKKKKKSPLKIIFNIIFYLLIIVVVLEALIGIVNMKRLNDGEQPIWYLTTKKEETENKITVEYNLGLYRIIKTDTKQDSRIVLKPFFITD